MEARERVALQIGHQETDFVPFAKLHFEGDVAERLDARFAGSRWRRTVERLNHIYDVSAAVPLRQWRDPAPGVEAQMRTDLFGSAWRTDTRPWHLERPVLAEPSLGGYRFPRAEEFFPPRWREQVLETLGGRRDRFLVAGTGAGFFECAWTLRGFENALLDSIAEPSFYERLLDGVAELQMQLLDRLLDLPVDGILFADDWADQRGVLLGWQRWRSFVMPRLAMMYERVHRRGKRVLSHCCGNVRELLPDLIGCGLEVLQSVQPEAMDPYELKREFGGDLAFWGGLGSQRLVPFGTPLAIRAEVRRLCDRMGRGGGYILGTAKYLQPDTPTENAAAVVEAFCAEAGLAPGE